MLKATFALVTFCSLISFADQEVDKAIEEVQKQMQHPSFQENAAQTSPQAAGVRDHVKAMSGSPETEQEIYQLAAEVLGNMKGKSMEEMKSILEQAQQNPASFAESFSESQKAKLRELANRLPAANKTKP